MVNVLSTTIEAPKLHDGQFFDNLLATVAKKDSERKILKQFLQPKLSEIAKTSQIEAENLSLEGLKPEAMVFYLSQLKLSGAFENMVLKTINNDTSRQLIQGKQPVLPPTFPGDHKKAEALVYGSISSSIGDRECRQYLVQKIIKAKVQNIAKDLFFAINHGLNDEQSIKYLSVIYELEKLQTAETQNSKSFRETIANSLSTQETVKLVHIKCLRYTYPKVGGVRIITDTKDTEVDGVLGKYVPKSEERLFERLSKINSIFQQFGIKTSQEVIISDEDIDLLFPDNHPFITPEHKHLAKHDAQKYIQFLETNYGHSFNFNTVNSLSLPINNQYQQLRQVVIRDLLSKGGKFMTNDFFEHDRVDHQQNYYMELFGPSYSRDEARRSISEQIASVIALQLIIKTYGKNIIIIEENREGENRLIAGGIFPTYFTTLRDPAKFGYVVNKINYRERTKKEIKR